MRRIRPGAVAAGLAVTAALARGSAPARAQAPGTLLTAAGTGQPGNDGDGGPASLATVNQPDNVRFDSQGNYFIFGSGPIRKVSSIGTITTFAGGGSTPLASFQDGFAPTSVAWPASFNRLATDPQDDLYVMTFILTSGPALGFKITPTGSMTSIGNFNLGRPFSMAFGAGGIRYVSDIKSHVVVRVDAQNNAQVVAGIPGTPGRGAEGVPGTATALNAPTGVALDADGNLFIGDYGNNRVRKLTPSGIITTAVGGGAQTDPRGDGGPASKAVLNKPIDLAFDGAGDLFICDNHDDRVRKVDTSGIITTVAGGGADFPGIGELATSASLSDPQAIALDGQGNLYIADTGHNRIVKVAGVGSNTSVDPNPHGALGDVDGDGLVTVRDALLALQYLTGSTMLAPEALTRADLNLDGMVTISDVALILLRAVEGG